MERGLASTRTADVAAAAGVSQALVFYHFETKDKLVAKAFEYAAEQDLARLEAVVASPAGPLEKLRKILKTYPPTGHSKAWEMWIDGWAEAKRIPELERASRRLDVRWRDAMAGVIKAGVAADLFTCGDPIGAAWRIASLVEGLAVQFTVHERIITRRQLGDWVRLSAARELGLTPEQLT